MSEQRRRFKIASYDDLSQIRSFLETTAIKLGADTEIAGDIVMAANEAVTNIFEHGFQEETCEIEIGVTYEAESTRLSVTITDNGPHFDPTQYDIPDLTLPLVQRTPGGMGIYMMSKFSDHISYYRTTTEENKLTLEIGGPHGD